MNNRKPVVYDKLPQEVFQEMALFVKQLETEFSAIAKQHPDMSPEEIKMVKLAIIKQLSANRSTYQSSEASLSQSHFTMYTARSPMAMNDKKSDDVCKTKLSL